MKEKLKKFGKVTLKILIFFLSWAIIGGIVDISFPSPVLWRFQAEFFPLLFIIIDSYIFWRIEKKNIQIVGWKKPVLNILTGLFVGLIWILVPIGILYYAEIIHFSEFQSPTQIWLWLISLFLNTIMQELLIRGYLYQLIKKEYHVVPAILFTTAIFTSFHGGAFEAGLIPVINVITMSLAMSFSLEYSGSLLLPIMMHGVYNLIDGIILGTGTVVEYPHMFSAIYTGPTILTGGSFEISGSIIITFMNVMLMLAFFILWRVKTFLSKNTK